MLFGREESASERVQLDRRRLEEGHIKYSILCISKQYPQSIHPIIKSSLKDTLEETIKPFLITTWVSACMMGCYIVYLCYFES